MESSQSDTNSTDYTYNYIYDIFIKENEHILSKIMLNPTLSTFQNQFTQSWMAAPVDFAMVGEKPSGGSMNQPWICKLGGSSQNMYYTCKCVILFCDYLVNI